MIDLNCDMGEGYGRWSLGPDEELLALVSSANVACGFHAGDPLTIDRTLAGAARAGVAVGAHVSYPDLVGFGRRHMTLAPDELAADVLFQIGGLDALCHRHGLVVRYVKAHGALYNDLVADRDICDAFARAVRGHRTRLPVLALAGSPAVGWLAEAGIEVVAEAFADRAYTAEGRLLGRSRPGAVIDDPARVAERAVRIAREEPIESAEGTPLRIGARSLCVHGDSPGAVALARAVRETLAAHGLAVEAFA